MGAGRLVVVGLGPAGADHLTAAARDALFDAQRCVARTGRHPAVSELRTVGLVIDTFDRLYEDAEHVGEVYEAIATELCDLVADGTTVAYAVPGSPAVAETSVALVQALASRRGIDVAVVAGLSFADLAFTRLGIDPVATGARIADAHDPATLRDAVGPVLVGQCDHPLVLSEVKLTLLDRLPPDTPVTVLARLGLDAEAVTTLPLVELDRVTPDHLTSVWVDVGSAAEVRALARLLELAVRLREPGGCPWDAEQTHHSLTRYLLEEAYEVVEAVEALPAAAPLGPLDVDAYAALEDELGDLLFQVIFHAVLAREAGAFGMAEIADGIHDKLVRRHPHVFGDIEAASSSDVMRNWEQIKKEEKGTDSIVAGITPGLPSLLYAHKLYRKAASIGLDPGDTGAALARLRAATTELEDVDASRVENVLGELLAAVVTFARASGVDAESALSGWAKRFRTRFETMEALAAQRSLDLASLDPAEVRALWDEA